MQKVIIDCSTGQPQSATMTQAELDAAATQATAAAAALATAAAAAAALATKRAAVIAGLKANADPILKQLADLL